MVYTEIIQRFRAKLARCYRYTADSDSLIRESERSSTSGSENKMAFTLHSEQASAAGDKQMANTPSVAGSSVSKTPQSSVKATSSDVRFGHTIKV